MTGCELRSQEQRRSVFESRTLSKSACTATLAALFTVSAPAQEAASVRRPPIVAGGGDPDMDACGSGGVVEGLAPHRDGFLTVKVGPCRSGWAHKRWINAYAG